VFIIEAGCKKKSAIGLSIIALIFYTLPVMADTSSEFYRLKKKDILAHIIGKVVTDETHWSDYYRKDGTVLTLSMGTEETGKWLIKNDELCIISKSANECYTVWQSGNQVELRLAGTDYPYAGVIKDYKEH